MQDRYAGDVGDFGKMGLLQALERVGFTIGVNWYRTLPDKNGDGKHEIKDAYSSFEKALADQLRKIHGDEENRSIQALQSAGLLEHAIYYDCIVNAADRAEWHRAAMEALKDCELVFLDPDNGLLIEREGKRPRKSEKHVLCSELCGYLGRGQSVVLYNHRPRKKFDGYLDDFRKCFAGMDEVRDRQITVMSFHRGTTRDFFLIAANEQHTKRIETATLRMIESPWGSKKMNLFSRCCL